MRKGDCWNTLGKRGPGRSVDTRMWLPTHLLGPEAVSHKVLLQLLIAVVDPEL